MSTPPETSALEIRLLGRPAFIHHDEEIVCSLRKAVWMAAHVYLHEQAQSRARLASLIWGGSATPRALGSLRVALTRLPPLVLDTLDISRDAIGVAAERMPRIDVHEFIACCEARDPASLERAVALYRGELLADADLDESPEFADWLFAERSRLRQLAHEAHVALAQAHRESGRAQDARRVADLWLQQQPADEAMHRLIIGWLMEDAGSDVALAQYDVYRRAVAVSQGAAPSSAMTELAERLRYRGDGGYRQSAPDSARDASEPLAAGTSFLGRDKEIAEVTDMLSDSGCRLVTLHGMGGIGKTRLALALADRMTSRAEFQDGVFVVALDSVASPALFAQTLARACGLQPAASASPLDLVAAFFRHRNALLVLDNLEHLLPAAADVESEVVRQIALLLRDTSGRLKILATSREPLRLQEEWVYPLSGLACPEEGEDGDTQAYSAVQLFVQRARQARAGFALAGNNREVVAICNMLEGLPLGVELAASWVDSIPTAELAASLRNHPSRHENRHRNRVERHRSLAAVVAYSWERLSDELRQVLSGLSALAGTFHAEAAAEIASASPAALLGLADKSLLMPAAGGRWHLHAVVRQYSREQCDAAPALRDTVRSRRDAYYLTWLLGAGERLKGAGEALALADIERESANIREAWTSAAATGNVALLDAAADPWFDFLESRSFAAEGMTAAETWLAAARAAKADTARALYFLGFFQRLAARNTEALATLDQAAKKLSADVSPIAAQVHAAKAFAHLLTGKLDEAEVDAKEALRQAETLQHSILVAAACRVLGLVMLQAGRREEGRELQQRALAIAHKLGRPSLLAAAHNNVAMADNHLGNYAEAAAGYENSLACWQELNATANIGRALHNLGVVATRQGNHGLALERYQVALDVLRKSGDRNLIALNLMSTGDALLRLGRPAEAREPARQALDMAENDQHMLPALDARIVLAQAATELFQFDDAARHLSIVLEAASQHRFTNVLADAIVSSARLLLAAVPMRRKDALRWAGSIAAAEKVSRTVKLDAGALLDKAGVPLGEYSQPDLEALASEALAAMNRLAG